LNQPTQTISEFRWRLLSARSASLTTGDAIGILDHLAPLSYFLDIPFISDNKELLVSAKKYYPQVKQVYIPTDQPLYTYLANHFDLLFVSSALYRQNLQPLCELFSGKKIEFCYCPHGNSDKSLKQFSLQNACLMYGDQMEERLCSRDLLNHLQVAIKTGHYRLAFYQKYKKFYDAIIEDEIFKHFAKKQQTLLFAPTWEDFALSSSLRDVALPLLKKLPSHFNLIIKPHPWHERNEAGFLSLLEQMCFDKGNAIILREYPLVLPLLQRVDLYLGDFSSIGYDYLYFNRPMFFFDTKKRLDKIESSSSFLHRCGELIPESKYQNIYQLIETSKDKGKNRERLKLYNYTFEKTIDFNSLKKQIFSNIVDSFSFYEKKS